MKSDLAPIVLFVYNRPWHTQKTLESLMVNELADSSRLYIYCDGPKRNASSQDLKKINEVRELVKEQNWCKEIIVRERSGNLGLAESVIQGVTEVIEEHGKVIVLEDDIVTGKYFLNFLNEGLRAYNMSKKVYGISGYCFPYNGKIKEDSFFLPVMSSWGYGTWKDRWQNTNFDENFLLNQIQDKGLESELSFGNLNFLQMLKDHISGKNNSWAVRFYVSMFLNKGAFLFPRQSLLKNIGYDGTGVNCGYEDSKIHNGNYENNLHLRIEKKKIILKPSVLKKFENSQAKNSNFNLLIKSKVKKLVAPELIKLIKRKVGLKNQKKIKQNEIPRYTETNVILDGREIIVPDYASYSFMQKEIFEEEIYKFKTNKKIPYIIDGGANIGLATIYLKKNYPEAEIVGFEPDPKIFRILKHNTSAFELRNVELVQKGLWNKESILDFWSEGADGGLYTDLDNSRPKSHSIETTSLIPFLNKQVDFLKLDIEGAETVVLRDIKDHLVKVDRIFVEYHSFVNQPQTLNEIIDILTAAGFRLYIFSPGLNSKSPFMAMKVYNNMDMQLNIYGIKKGLNQG